MKPKQYYFHTDPGHGWLAVKRNELVRLGILDKISGFSYQRGETVYLEEDCDASIFLNTKESFQEELKIKETYRENTPIRNYSQFVA